MTVLTDTDLYRRGIETLPASWEEHARGVTDATVHRLPSGRPTAGPAARADRGAGWSVWQVGAAQR